jgi:hypothetical protein
LIICIIISLLLYFVPYIIKKIKIISWKKEEDVVRIYEAIKEAKKAIKRENIEVAREKYHKIKELYPLIPTGCKKHVYRSIKTIRIFIDKKDIFNLVKEYETSKKEKRLDDAAGIKNKIKDNYKRLPKKLRKIVDKKIN